LPSGRPYLCPKLTRNRQNRSIHHHIIGQKIQTLLNKPLPAGYHEVEFNGQNLPSGVYLYRIQAGEWHDVKKMVLLK